MAEAEHTHQIEYLSSANVTTLPGGGEYLLVTIKLRCPVCGEIEMELPGHHLRALRNLLIEYVDMYPDLTGKDDEIQVLARLMVPPDNIPVKES